MSALALPDLAQAIDREHEAALTAARTAIEHAAECGRLLLQAKPAVPHGEWLQWLEANTSVSARQSQRYMRLATAALEGKYDATSHLTIEGALKAIADQREPRRHPVREMPMEKRREWFARFQVDRRAWAVYLDADRVPLADIAAFIGESEGVARALIRPAVDPGWHWELEADPKADSPDARQFHALTQRIISPLTEYLIECTRYHALWHAEEIRSYEQRDELAAVLATLQRDCLRRAGAAAESMRPAVAQLPRRFVCGLYGACAYLAVDACMGEPVPYIGGLWHLVGQCALADEPLGVSWAERYAAAEPTWRFQRIADGILGASEVLAYVGGSEP